MFVPFAFLLLLLSVPLAGGRLSGLAQLRLRGAGWICGALALQVAMTSLTSVPRPVSVSLHAASYAAVAWALWLNRTVPGLLLIALGGGTNAAVIALNGGTLPARPAALAESGVDVDAESFQNSGVVAEPVLPWLGDIVATPAFLPFRNVISVGDVVVLLGGAVLLHTLCHSRLARAARRAGRPGAEDGRAAAPRPASA